MPEEKNKLTTSSKEIHSYIHSIIDQKQYLLTAVYVIERYHEGLKDLWDYFGQNLVSNRKIQLESQPQK